MSSPRGLALATSCVVVAIVVALLVAPYVRAPLAVADAVTFIGAIIVSFAAVGIGAHDRPPVRFAAILVAIVAVALVAIAVVHPSTRWLAPVVDALLVAGAVVVGASIGARVEHAGHLLPACFVASAADVVSVFSPHGATHAVVENERALSVLAFSFPIVGSRNVAPAIGVGDLVFAALVLAVAARHALPYVRVAILAALGVVAAGVLSATLERAIPALPTLSLAVLAGIPGARNVARKDRTAATIAIGASVVVAAWAIVTAARA